MSIVGVSFDSPAANEAWAEREGFTFELWTDSDKTLALTYGSIDDRSEFFAGRVTRILDAEGVLLVEYDDVSVGVHPGQVLEDCETIWGQ